MSYLSRWRTGHALACHAHVPMAFKRLKWNNSVVFLIQIKMRFITCSTDLQIRNTMNDETYVASIEGYYNSLYM